MSSNKKPKFYPSQRVKYEDKPAIVLASWWEKDLDEFFYEIEITARTSDKGLWSKIPESQLKER